jgi:glutamate transport system permease protein
VDALLDNLPLIRDGFLTTLRLTLISAAIALVLGTVLGACRVSPVPTLRWFGAVYVELLRNTPLTLVFFFFVFVAPQVDVKLPFDVSAVVALSLYTAAFVCEAVRSGVNSVGVGQAEAARSIGLTFTQSMRHVVLPQALRTVVPPLINIFIALTKNTSVAVGFFVTELMAVGVRLASRNAADVVVILLGIAVCYLIITIPAGILAGRLERRVAFAR